MEEILKAIKLVEAFAPIIGGIIDGGTKVYHDVMTALADNGVEVDTATLDAIIADAEARRARAAAEAGE